MRKYLAFDDYSLTTLISSWKLYCNAPFGVWGSFSPHFILQQNCFLFIHIYIHTYGIHTYMPTHTYKIVMTEMDEFQSKELRQLVCP